MAIAKTTDFPSNDITTFQKTGLYWAPSLFADCTKELRQWADELHNMPKTKVWHYFETNMLQNDEKIISRTENFFGKHTGLSAFIQSERLQATLSDLFGETARLFKEKINYKLLGNAGFEPHQDSQAGWGSYADYFISVGIAIDPQRADGGCLEFIPENYSRRLVGELWKPLTENDIDFSRFCPFPAESGDAFFFDSYVPHRSKSNTVAASQRILYLTFNKNSAGNFRTRYYADKFKSFPPDNYRKIGVDYAYKV